jgi:CRP/FNR family cyclic AMP-dependent transcriptional regulator
VGHVGDGLRGPTTLARRLARTAPAHGGAKWGSPLWHTLIRHRCGRSLHGLPGHTLNNVISIIDADSDLADLLAEPERERARREALTRVRRLSVGAWNAAEAVEADAHHRGFLIIDGLLSREVEVLGRRCIELLGAGDVLRPWRWDSDGSHVHAEVGWVVLEPTRLAVLDHRLVLRMNPWPQLGLELFARGTRRAHGLAVALAIAHHPRVEDRLLLTLWHLAERWGRVRPDGIVVPLPLPPQRRADLVGAHRPSVTTAMGELVRTGALSRQEDGVWTLHGAPPDQLRHHRLVAAMS